MASQRPARSLPPRIAPAARPNDIVRLARERFLKGERIELPEIAAELGISRATAYRDVVNTENLVGLVIASLVDDTTARTRKEVRTRGARRVADVVVRGMRYTAAFRPLRAFLEKDAEKGMRIIASKDGPVQRNTIGQLEALLEEEIADGHLDLPVDVHTMAYAICRLVESFLYADLIAGEKPDLDKAEAIIRLMLPEPRDPAPRKSPPSGATN